MSSMEDFAAECGAAAKALRRVPREVRRALAAEVKTEVAAPLANRIAAAANGPHARALSGAVKARASAEPQVVIGGARKVVSGGASPRQLVYGNEFGGGKRTTRVPTTAKRSGYRRRSTNQFVPRRPFIYPTLAASTGWVLDAYADIVLKVLDNEVPGGR